MFSLEHKSIIRRLGQLAVAATGLLAASGYSATQCQNPTPIWADEFDGTAVDTSKWEFQNGDGCSYGICGWGNNELQSYQSANATVANGILTIIAKKQRVGSKAYTSARMRTLNMPNGGQWKNGRFEARIKLPKGAGMWPAFWMLPANTSVGWPMSGEIDIMEATGQADMFAFGTLHYGEAWPNNSWTSGRILKQPDAWSDAFHTYAIEWEPNVIRWYVNDVLYSTKTPQDLGNTSWWTFEDYQYYLILNLAVGGNLGGWVDDSMLPQTLQVDYVRIYDFGKPNLSGKHIVDPNTSATYSVIDETGTGSSYSWTTPTGQTSTGSSINVNWGTQGGPVRVTVSNSCGSYNLELNVHVSPTLTPSIAHEDFELNRNLTYKSWTGTFNQAATNPAPNTINSSSVVGSYARNGTSQWDTILASTTQILNASDFVKGNKAFYMDVYTAAPLGTEILVQLENSSVATASNYPNGRHSKYVAHTTQRNAWHRLKFVMEDRIDGATSDTSVNQVVLLLAPNSFTSDSYLLDNFSTYAQGSTAPSATSMNVSSVVTGTASAGGNKKFATATVTVVDNNGNPVANATVTGNFSGTISQTGVSGATGSDGKVTLKTTTSASGSVTVNFCVSSLTHSSLSHNIATSTGLCP